MKKLLIVIALLCSMNAIAQVTPSTRRLVASVMDDAMIDQGLPISISTFGDTAQGFMISAPLIDDYERIAAFLKGMNGTGGIYPLFKVYKFQYVCFKEMDKCYSYEDLEIILGYIKK